MSTAKNGSLVLLKIETATPGTFVPVLSAKSNNFTWNNSTVDVSTKLDGRFGAKLSGGGTTEMTVSLEGIFLDTEYDKQLRELGVSGAEHKYQMVLSNGDKFEGLFVITSMTCTGARGESETYSFNLANSGEVTFTPAP